MKLYFLLCLAFIAVVYPVTVDAVSMGTATTTLSLSICGNELVDEGEQCDVLGETGQYSTTIAGRQCNAVCKFGPYCGDGILQTQFSEECDDGNNENSDFCSAICKIEPAGSGGGGSSGGGSGGGGGSRTELGNTVISVVGLAYPGRTINVLLDTQTVGNVRVGSNGRFEFTTPASPGTASLGFWSLDNQGTRSITLNSTFDVTQGAVTNISGIILPPTIRVPNPNVNPGDVVTVSGQAVPNATIELHLNNSEKIETTVSGSDGTWSFALNTASLRVAGHTLRARSVSGTPPLTTQSSFSSAIQIFVGVDGQVTRPSDLNRDGKINLVDFSILIFWWGTNAGNSSPSADINGNGKVGIEDFSILLFNWTG
ncbi:MAG TPA: dockerin type I domain-containing protein [Candidatus Paceibacterota bacterium]|nr:dockerin type I domain-containing protein [Candidatus Paceibacterota bacterium]